MTLSDACREAVAGHVFSAHERIEEDCQRQCHRLGHGVPHVGWGLRCSEPVFDASAPTRHVTWVATWDAAR